MTSHTQIFISAALLCMSPMAAYSKATVQDADALVKSLVEKRSKVEELTEELENKKRERRAKQRAFENQKAQLDAELQRESVRHAQLTEAMQRKKVLIEASKERDAALLPIFEKNAAALKRYVETSLPFRQGERLAEVDLITQKLSGGLLSPRSALTRLWSLIEDERQMAKETGLYRDTVTVDGQKLMVDVVRIGTIGLYFRTGTGRVGLVTRSDSGWTTTFVDEERGRLQINHLFDSFKKQIRVGLFDLPNMLPMPEGR